MKKGFTFAELMISLLVISVLSAILYPTIAQFTPNANKPLFKSAYRTLTTVLSEILNESTTGDIPTENHAFCEAFCGKANIIKANTADTCATLCANNTLTTSNGMRWYFSNRTIQNEEDGSISIIGFNIYVDVNASNNDLATVNESVANEGIADVPFIGNGVFYYYDNSQAAGTGIYNTLPAASPPDGILNQDKLKAQDTFKFEIDNKGKITYISPAGWAHLSDSTQSPD